MHVTARSRLSGFPYASDFLEMRRQPHRYNVPQYLCNKSALAGYIIIISTIWHDRPHSRFPYTRSGPSGINSRGRKLITLIVEKEIGIFTNIINYRRPRSYLFSGENCLSYTYSAASRSASVVCHVHQKSAHANQTNATLLWETQPNNPVFTLSLVQLIKTRLILGLTSQYI